MEIVITILDDGTTTVAAIDLTGDCWRDYLHYLKEARTHSTTGDMLVRNRSTRAALINLFSHLDGVVSGLWQKLRNSSETFKPPVKNERHCSLKMKIRHLRDHAREHLNKHLPDLNLHLKLLRDILAHPSISKKASKHSEQAAVLTGADVVDLSVNDLEKEGETIACWLNELCETYNFPRKHDTEEICREWASLLGEGKDIREF